MDHTIKITLRAEQLGTLNECLNIAIERELLFSRRWRGIHELDRLQKKVAGMFVDIYTGRREIVELEMSFDECALAVCAVRIPFMRAWTTETKFHAWESISRRMELSGALYRFLLLAISETEGTRLEEKPEGKRCQGSDDGSEKSGRNPDQNLHSGSVPLDKLLPLLSDAVDEDRTAAAETLQGRSYKVAFLDHEKHSLADFAYWTSCKLLVLSEHLGRKR